MKPFNDRALANGSLVVLLAIGLVLLALLVLAPGYAQAGLDQMQPVSLQSGLQANYSADPLGLAIQPIELKAVEQSIADRTTYTVSSRQQAAAAIDALNTPVFTVTPMQSKTLPVASSPTSPKPTQKNTLIANTSTRQVLSTATAAILVSSTATRVPSSTNTAKPLIPTKAVFSPTPDRNIVTLQPTKTPTKTPVVIPATQTALPSKTQTWTPKPPVNTVSATLKPATRTSTPKPPTRTNTPPAYPPPATKITAKTPTLPAYP